MKKIIKPFVLKFKFGAFIILSLILFLQNTTFAQKEYSAQDYLKQGILFYDDSVCSTDVYSNTGQEVGSIAATNDTSVYQSNLDPPYNVEQFVTHVLKDIAIKTSKPESSVVTQEHIVALVTFARIEGGGVDGNAGNFNLFNTKLHTSDLNAIPRGTEDESRVNAGLAPVGNNSPATYDYPSFDVGVEATARSMVSSTYQSRLINALTDPSVTAERFFYILTYYKDYKDNLSWSGAASENPEGYLNQMLDLLKSTRSSYKQYAGKLLNGSDGNSVVVGDGGISSANSGCSASSDTDLSLITGSSTFTTNSTVSIPGVDEAVARAKRIADMSSNAFKIACDGSASGLPLCSQQCDHLAGEVWGYSSSGYASAKVHYQTLLVSGKIHKDRNPPVGASLFYESGEYGHITTYLGNGLLISNDVLDGEKGITGGAYIVPTDSIEKGPWNLTYLGWAEPIFAGGIRKPSI